MSKFKIKTIDDLIKVLVIYKYQNPELEVNFKIALKPERTIYFNTK